MTEERPIVVCTPTSDGMPVVPSNPRKCAQCGQSVWMSVAAGHFADEQVVCLPCAMPRLKDTKPEDVRMAPWVPGDYASWLKRQTEKEADDGAGD